MIIKLAFRNLWRNRRRSIATICAIAFGFAAITLFGGYITNIYGGLARISIEGEKLGHLTIAKPGYFDFGNINQEKYIFSLEEQKNIQAVLKSYPEIVLITPRLSISGLISNGKQSTIFIGDGIDPTAIVRIRQNFQAQNGGFLQKDNPTGIAIAENLAEALALKKGDTGVLFVSTLEGQANALDFDAIDVYDTGNAATNDKAIILPFKMAQNLLDTQGAERLTVLLTNRDLTQSMQKRLSTALKNAGINVEIKTWVDLSNFYRQVRGMFNMIFSFIFTIVLVIVVMSIINTMSMVVMERTREIGTLRAIGMQRPTLIRLFSMEGFWLGLIGCLAGVLLTFIIGIGVNHAGFSYIAPSLSTRVFLLIDFNPYIIFAAFIALCAFSIAASLLPARKAAHANISQALRFV